VKRQDVVEIDADAPLVAEDHLDRVERPEVLVERDGERAVLALLGVRRADEGGRSTRLAAASVLTGGRGEGSSFSPYAVSQMSSMASI
jgi:hypothetical protein